MIRYELVPIYKREWIKQQIDMFPLSGNFDIQMKLSHHYDFMSIDEYEYDYVDIDVENDFINSGTGMII